MGPIAFSIGFACTKEFEACLSYQEALKKEKPFWNPHKIDCPERLT
jgi:hypothetical protein